MALFGRVVEYRLSEPMERNAFNFRPPEGIGFSGGG
jgi:hypothetical protein